MVPHVELVSFLSLQFQCLGDFVYDQLSSRVTSSYSKLIKELENRFEPNLAEMFIGWSYTRFLFLALIHAMFALNWLTGFRREDF
jgi:hypothetical protein